MNPISLGGQVMLDGGLGTGAGIPLHMAEEDGYERFLFVTTRPAGYRKSPMHRGSAACSAGSVPASPPVRGARHSS